MAEPWVKRSAGELLSSEDWNNMQLQARGQIQALDKRVTDSLAEAEARLTTSLARGAQVRAAFMQPAPGAQPFAIDSVQFESGVRLNNTNWTEVPSPQLDLSLAVTSVVLLRADAWLWISSSSNTAVYTLFILNQGGKRAPARMNPNLTTSGYIWPCEPNAKNWPAWLDYHNKTSWPVRGADRRVDGIQGYNGAYPLRMEEAVELPPGDYKVQMGYALGGYGDTRYLKIPRSVRVVRVRIPLWALCF